MTPYRQQELLSYFQGLAPIGETFEVPMNWIKSDLGFRNMSAIRNLITDLIVKGAVRRIAVGQRASCGVLVVLKRVEAL